jgi:hypothetical protein
MTSQGTILVHIIRAQTTGITLGKLLAFRVDILAIFMLEMSRVDRKVSNRTKFLIVRTLDGTMPEHVRLF